MRLTKPTTETLGLTTTRSLSSGITKGTYLNQYGRLTNHPRRSETIPDPVNFIGIDGEGITTPSGEHKYVVLGVGEDHLIRPDGIRWDEAFEFIYSHHAPRTAFVGFYLGYDFSQIFKTLPEKQAWLLLSTNGRELRKHVIAHKPTHAVMLNGWQFDILGMKRLRIRPKECDCLQASCKCLHKPWLYVCDAGSFFQTSFLNVIDPKGWADDTAIVTPEQYETICDGKAKRAYATSCDADMLRYNALENVLLADVMRTLQNGFRNIGVHLPPQKWFGPGQAAQSWLSTQQTVPSTKLLDRFAAKDLTRKSMLEAARMSYFGGWFEIFMHGIIPGSAYEYDINSAYPTIIAKLPCLLHGKYSKGEGMPPVGADEDYTLVYARILSKAMPNPRTQWIGTMLHRDSKGRISRPYATEGWFWLHELYAAQRAGLIKRLDNRGKQQIQKWIRYEACKCPPPMAGIAGLYQKRLEVGKTSPLGKAAKLVYNSAYGKFAQSVGSPRFGNPIYASLITAGCRTQILDAIATHPNGINDVTMVATDAVYFLTPHPGLRISSALGDWDYKERVNLTQFKPGVYWDDEARKRIAKGGNPAFKTRGFKPSDFAGSIAGIDREFRSWNSKETPNGNWRNDWAWPTVTFNTEFFMTTAIQALQRNNWATAGEVIKGQQFTQSCNPGDKRDVNTVTRVEYNGRTIYRTRPYNNLTWDEEGNEVWPVSHPYEKRFGLDDPWSDEYQAQLGELPEGAMGDIFNWLLREG